MTARQANLLGALALALSDRLATATAAESGRTGQGPAALAVLGQDDGLGIEGLRSQLGLSQSATVRLVDSLVADGLATRRPGADARTVRVVLTAVGRRRAAALLAARQAVLDEAMGPLSAAERAQLEVLLETVLAALTTDRTSADVICRLCDLAACPEPGCPVECAVSPERKP